MFHPELYSLHLSGLCFEPNFYFYSIGKLHAEMLGSAPPELAQSNHLLYDHRPLKLNIEDYQRVCHIPVKKV